MAGEAFEIIHPPGEVDVNSYSEKMIADPGRFMAQHAALKGDYVVYGSLVKLGDILTTDAFLYDKAAGKILLHFNNMGKGEETLLVHLSEFAKQIGDLFNPTKESGTPVIKEERSSSPADKSSKIWKSHYIGDKINGMTVVDLDNDKKPEIAVVFDNRMVVYKMVQGKLEEIGSASDFKSRIVVGIDSADLDGDGYPEFFVSALTDDRKDISSSIYRWDGKSFISLKSNLGWIFRVGTVPGEKNRVVLAQKNKSLGSILGSPIYSFENNGGDYIQKERFNLPEVNSLYSGAFSDSKTGPLKAVYGMKNRIQVYDGSSNIVWESDDSFGGSPQAMVQDDVEDKNKKNFTYLEPRMLFEDIDHDGAVEMACVKNDEVSNHLFSGLKVFSKGRIVIFTQGGLGFSKRIETEPVSGYVSDFTLADMDGDGATDLVYAMVTKGETWLSKKKSFIVVQYGAGLMK
jgi:hypothetical protein